MRIYPQRVFINWIKAEAGDGEHRFVESIEMRRRARPVDAFVIGGWTLILVKCVLASLAIRRWDIPIHDFYVWGPSLMFGALCTWLYLRGEAE